MLTQLRKLILQASPDLVEEWKGNTPVWSQHGTVVAFGAFNNHVQLNFFIGASRDDPKGLFNGGLEARANRGIDIQEDGTINVPALKGLVQDAASLNKDK